MDEPTRGDDLLASLGRSYEPLHERFGSRHAELLNAIEGDTRVRLVAEPCGEARWAVSIAAVDAVGVLAVIAGLFAGNRIDIRNGDVFSLRLLTFAPPPAIRWRIRLGFSRSAEPARALDAPAIEGWRPTDPPRSLSRNFDLLRVFSTPSTRSSAPGSHHEGSGCAPSPVEIGAAYRSAG